MGEGITLAGSSNAAESPTRERPGAFGTTPSNNEASNVVHLDESHQESPGLVYTRSSFSGGSSSCGYSKSESRSQEVASQKSEDTDLCIRSPSSSQSNSESDPGIPYFDNNHRVL
ncbi:hypothetical protein PNOK_0673000 [Pyrrhoderma noxium]|uniref:Uncharacterized protein n=1 Tax=Pyrrhoderma noxium TaxID=2282107 RepID=A0A286UFH1_9AGAM|nr:hypothetical protein PNOK_0673000 [Pyrrhoderma noxium]